MENRKKTGLIIALSAAVIVLVAVGAFLLRSAGSGGGEYKTAANNFITEFYDVDAGLLSDYSAFLSFTAAPPKTSGGPVATPGISAAQDAEKLIMKIYENISPYADADMINKIAANRTYFYYLEKMKMSDNTMKVENIKLTDQTYSEEKTQVQYNYVAEISVLNSSGSTVETISESGSIGLKEIDGKWIVFSFKTIASDYFRPV